MHGAGGHRISCNQFPPPTTATQDDLQREAETEARPSSPGFFLAAHADDDSVLAETVRWCSELLRARIQEIRSRAIVGGGAAAAERRVRRRGWLAKLSQPASQPTRWCLHGCGCWLLESDPARRTSGNG